MNKRLVFLNSKRYGQLSFLEIVPIYYYIKNYFLDKFYSGGKAMNKEEVEYGFLAIFQGISGENRAEINENSLQVLLENLLEYFLSYRSINTEIMYSLPDFLFLVLNNFADNAQIVLLSLHLVVQYTHVGLLPIQISGQAFMLDRVYKRYPDVRHMIYLILSEYTSQSCPDPYNMIYLNKEFALAEKSAETAQCFWAQQNKQTKLNFIAMTTCVCSQIKYCIFTKRESWDVIVQFMRYAHISDYEVQYYCFNFIQGFLEFFSDMSDDNISIITDNYQHLVEYVRYLALIIDNYYANERVVVLDLVELLFDILKRMYWIRYHAIYTNDIYQQAFAEFQNTLSEFVVAKKDYYIQLVHQNRRIIPSIVGMYLYQLYIYQSEDIDTVVQFFKQYYNNDYVLKNILEFIYEFDDNLIVKKMLPEHIQIIFDVGSSDYFVTVLRSSILSYWGDLSEDNMQFLKELYHDLDEVTLPPIETLKNIQKW